MNKDIDYSKLKKICLGIIVLTLVIGLGMDIFSGTKKVNQKASKDKSIKTARIMANGDILIHNVLYASAQKSDGTYDFNPYFEYVKDRISSADLAIGDYEGTISSDYPLAGYPLFNAPSQIADAIKNTGYDVIDLAHNHILDSGLDGAINTVNTFKKIGIDSIGVYTNKRSSKNILIKNVNGIKIAILGYSYGYNGMEANLSKSEYNNHMSDLKESKIRADLKEAEKKADITVVMPQMGTEYALQPTSEQKTLYHKMINWGADIIFGGHPHVVEPAETLRKNGQKKFIIYSMGNFISNQREETVDNIWTERGLLMDAVIQKKGNKTSIKSIKAHPTMVLAKGKGINGSEGYELFSYRTLILEDFIKGGKYRDKIDDATKARVDTAYKETNEHVNLVW
ncbi:hypothetical protein HMPREF9318_00217 [Streptococcus urinalis FB127-CNA-2]|uniref:Bacterial capsule synthesis protein n=1 Tax=Streptococcus urinalis 2285-97 TaxID=764291 RepID=G5KFB7_9STRE|nr:CapA family protein [Streptococcus urinalis]EHJ56511.1 bacterial capsule synthesis protein [Streptococcus urinalis 2285-97]EKS22019.1 hypothetical protein HMPREF9318_00217 [Streptococcus urinalis FB127-CNA-2]VEF31831.1 membrane protein [Streptococcus urinalis]